MSVFKSGQFAKAKKKKTQGKEKENLVSVILIIHFEVNQLVFKIDKK